MTINITKLPPVGLQISLTRQTAELSDDDDFKNGMIAAIQDENYPAETLNQILLQYRDDPPSSPFQLGHFFAILSKVLSKSDFAVITLEGLQKEPTLLPTISEDIDDEIKF